MADGSSWTDTTPAEFLSGFAGRTRRLPDGPREDGTAWTYCDKCMRDSKDDAGKTCRYCGEGTMLLESDWKE